jgi:hypothetical protein
MKKERRKKSFLSFSLSAAAAGCLSVKRNFFLLRLFIHCEKDSHFLARVGSRNDIHEPGHGAQ